MRASAETLFCWVKSKIEVDQETETLMQKELKAGHFKSATALVHEAVRQLVYRVKPKLIEIVAILHGRRDLKRVFRGR